MKYKAIKTEEEVKVTYKLVDRLYISFVGLTSALVMVLMLFVLLLSAWERGGELSLEFFGYILGAALLVYLLFRSLKYMGKGLRGYRFGKQLIMLHRTKDVDELIEQDIEESNDKLQAEIASALEFEKKWQFGKRWLLLVRAWGVLTRSLFIPAIGLLCYGRIDPVAIGGKPISQLTFNELSDNVFAIIVLISCLYWFLSFPENKVPGSPKDSPYIKWAAVGAWFVALAGIGVFLIRLLV
jgi:hypothetical protein